MQEAAPTSSAITDDLLCIRCRYNLRSLAADGACPECGTKIAETLRPTWLLFANVAWLDALRRGTTCLLIGVVLGFVTVRLEHSWWVTLLIERTWYTALLLVWARGFWLLSMPERPPSKPELDHPRRQFRIALVVATHPLLFACTILPWVHHPWARLLSVLSPLAVAPVLWCLAEMLGQLDDPRHVRHFAPLARIAAVGSILSLTARTMLQATDHFLPTPSGPLLLTFPNSLPRPLLIAYIAASLSAAVFYICWLVVLSRLRKTIREALDPARRHRASSAPADLPPASHPSQQLRHP